MCYYISDRLKNAHKRYLAALLSNNRRLCYPSPHSVSYENIKIMLILIKKIFLLSHICYYTSRNWIKTPNRYLAKFVKLLQAFISPPPTPFCNIPTNKYRLKFSFAVTYMLLHIKQIDYHHKRYLAKLIKLLQAFLSPPPL